MRIALVHKRWDRLGGAEWDCWESASQLVARGHDVHLVVGECRVAVAPGLTLHRVPVLRTGQLAKLLSFALLAPPVWRAIDADVVIGFGRTVGPDIFRASGGCHRRYLDGVMAERGGWPAWRLRLSPYQRALLALERRQYGGGYRKILTVSSRARDELLATYPTVRDEDVAVLRYGVDASRFRVPDATTRAAARRELGIDGEQAIVLFVGTGFRRKGVDVLLDIWAREPPAGAALVVAGNDRHRAAYERRARDLRGRVVFTGPRLDVERLYAAADLFVLPSAYEAFGMVVLEALACGLPVVASRGLGAAELLTGPLAELLVDDPRDPAEVAARIAAGLDRRRPELAAAAQAVAAGATLERTFDALESWCRLVAHERGRADV